MYSIKLKDGSSAFGRIVSGTDDKVVVQYIANKQRIAKTVIAPRLKLENSIMPSNLHSLISEAEIVGLIEYLSRLKRKT